MFRTTRIRTKLAVALAVPLAALVAVAGFEVAVAKGEVDETRSQAELATSSLGPGSLVSRLQDERNRASLDLIGLDTELPVDTNEEARALTDPSAAEFQAFIAGRSDEVRAAFAPAFEAYEQLDGLRADIDTFDGPMDLSNDELANEVFSRYTDIIESFFDATSSVALAVDGAELRNGVEIVDAATRQSEMRARIVRSLVLAVVTGTADDPSVGQEVAALLDRSRGFDADIRTNAIGPYEGVADATFAEAGVQSFNQQVAAFLGDGAVDLAKILESVGTNPDIGYLALRTRTAGLLDQAASRLVDEAQDRQRTFVLVAAGTLILAIVVTWAASRSITRPLRSLKEQAEEMAHERLPAAVRQILDTPPGEDVVIPEVAPIEVRSRDEVREVAATLSAVQSSALDLAVEQAVLRRNIADSYINLGRRNQNLLSRQLDYITELERNESDPDTLEGLFRLDHMATRMRRNAESLLVLAGIEPPRQWAAPVKVSDVVRAALGEVEAYQRVVVRHLEPAALTGAVAADLAHVLAELLENGLSFSPPEQTVEVKGRLTTEGYTVAISDNGLGMSPADLERANRRLAGKESFTVAPSRYLGHYVAGHLASRLGVAVQLQENPGGGISARVDIPMSLVVSEELDQAAPAAQAAPPAATAPPAPAPQAAAPAATAPPAPAPESPSATVHAPRAEPAPAPTTPNGLPRRAAPAHLATGDHHAAPTEPAAADHAEPATADAATRQDVAPPPAEPAAGPWAEGDAAPPPALQPIEQTAEHASRGPAASPPAVPDAPAAAPTATAPAAPGSDPSTRGFGGLAVARPSHGSMYSVAARNARQVDDGQPVDEPAATASGLVKRVPGAQRPDAAFGRPSETAPAGPLRSSPEDVYSFLSSFQSGVARGRADAHAADVNESPEDDR